MNRTMHILTLNCGSSSLKLALYRVAAQPVLELAGGVERIGDSGGRIRLADRQGQVLLNREADATDHQSAVVEVLRWLARRRESPPLDAVGHRLVHGGPRFSRPRFISAELLQALEALSPLVPDHLPRELAVIRVLRRRQPQLRQVACFDTAFHRALPATAREYALPAWARQAGVRRYGFHGLSYEYVMGHLEEVAGTEAARGRVVIAHLGHGASMAAVRGGRPVDTTMGLTPTGGLVMSRRSGDLDPGVLLYLMQRENMTAEAINDLVNRESGLLGRSGITADMRDLLGRAPHNADAEGAVELYCYQARKFLGAMAAALGGLDTLIFTGGIGENAPPVRDRICAGLDFLGVRLDNVRNDAGAPVISADGSDAVVRVIRTDEQLMIAQHTWKLLTRRKRAAHEWNSSGQPAASGHGAAS
jgi:acetate kinase